MPNLKVLEIERFAIHDGPGIRSTVFLQGCPLRCPWCANPESQEIRNHLMYKEESCLGCGSCTTVCPLDAITVSNGKIIIDRKKCDSCGKCGEVCPTQTMRFAQTEMNVDDIVKELAKDEAYYQTSNGGITISGGEAFVQFDGFLELIKECKSKGYHVAVETTGQTTKENLIKALPYIDLFLFDIKHTNPLVLKDVTLGKCEVILENLKLIDPSKVHIRMPIVPEFNFDDEHIIATLNIAKEQGIKRVDILPYHRLGVNKYKQLGMKYNMKEFEAVHPSELEKYREFGEKYGIHISIGG